MRLGAEGGLRGDPTENRRPHGRRGEEVAQRLLAVADITVVSTHGLVLARPAAWRARVSAVIPLPTMLSHTLVAWTVEADNAFEQRMPHCTTASRRRGEVIQGPWLVSFPMYVHCMRHLTAEGVTRGELEDRARVLGPVLGLERWGYVTLAPAPRQGKRKADPRATIVSPTRAGRKAQRLWAALPDEVDARWNARYGPTSLRRLRKSLIAAAANLDSELPDFLPVIHFKAGLLNLLPSDERVTVLHRTPRSVHPETTPDPTALPLYTLLSRVLLAFAIEYEHEAELSLALGANVVRVLDDVGVEVAELPRLAGVSKEAIANNLVALGKRGYVVVEKSPGKRTRQARLTPRGLAAQKNYLVLTRDIERRWATRFGSDVLRNLRSSLEAIVVTPDLRRSPLAKAYGPLPGTWRADVTAPATLPHFPMVLHRGGFPDGA